MRGHGVSHPGEPLCVWKKDARMSCGVFKGEWVHPSVSRREVSLLWAKAYRVLSRSLRIMCADSISSVSRMSRTEDRPAPMPRVCMNRSGEDFKEDSLFQATYLWL